MSKISEIAVLAIEALGDELSQTLALEEILRICTNTPNMESAKKVAIDLRAKEKNLATIDDYAVSHYKAKYGYHEGYPKFQLALDFFQMSNDLFFEKYKFNFVPRGELYKEVKSLLEKRLELMSISQMISPLVADNTINSLNLSAMSSIKGTFQSGA